MERQFSKNVGSFSSRVGTKPPSVRTKFPQRQTTGTNTDWPLKARVFGIAAILGWLSEASTSASGLHGIYFGHAVVPVAKPELSKK